MRRAIFFDRVGDSLKDIEAGRTAGCKTILIDAEYNKKLEADFRVKGIDSAVRIILNGGNR